MREAATPAQRLRRVLLTVGPGAFWLVLFVLIPTLIVLVVSLMSRGSLGQPVPPFGLHNYVRFFSDPLFLEIIGRSLWIGLWSTLLVILLGYPLAFYIAQSRYKEVLLLLVVIPFFTNFLIRVYAWIVVFQKEGLLNAFITAFGLPPAELLPSTLAVYVATVYTYLPFFVLPLYAAVERIDWSLLEAAYDLGARPVRAFFEAIFPQTLPGLLAGFLLVFIPAVGTFVIADLLGGGKVTLVGNLIQLQFGSAQNWAFGSAASMVLMAMVLLGLWLYARTQGERGLDRLV
ncbi:Spermidine/putrescine transport system permease protein PotB [Meiothermus luteus]|jgi:spermidine/putrescine transport system permease protein|uniref:Spermidine/putrescine transport system permease protein PotB n=1 Tax=Meiothermus luteus TaxID=2026184 RepID=A0A399ERV6_9DEIN|nr:ABC transporter permease [Meiothermus luteus]RIH86525.1 Spermidine/putrescine transport system permease protein PotB [Meiothermus luteus]RMH54349.1 MAG: ABC transporter permease subunit [Deinococcota bacterium]